MSYETQEWFTGAIANAKAVQMLRNGPAGCFLVRESETTPGNFVIQVKSSTIDVGVRSWRISRQSEGGSDFFLLKGGGATFNQKKFPR